MDYTPRRSFLRRVGLGLVGFVATAEGLTKASSVAANGRAVETKITSESLAGVALGDSSVIVQEVLGSPEQESFVHGYGGTQWAFPSIGVFISFDCVQCSQMKVKQVTTTTSGAGKTSKGVSVGSSTSELQSLYDIDSEQFEDSISSGKNTKQQKSVTLSMGHGQSICFTHADNVISSISLQDDSCQNCASEDLDGSLQLEDSFVERWEE